MKVPAHRQELLGVRPPGGYIEHVDLPHRRSRYEERRKDLAKVRSLSSGFETHLPKSNERVVREDFSVVYGIMRKPYADGSIGLPFFSKVSLQAAAERIAQFGIPWLSS